MSHLLYLFLCLLPSQSHCCYSIMKSFPLLQSLLWHGTTFFLKQKFVFPSFHCLWSHDKDSKSLKTGNIGGLLYHRGIHIHVMIRVVNKCFVNRQLLGQYLLYVCSIHLRVLRIWYHAPRYFCFPISGFTLLQRINLCFVNETDISPK